MFGGATVDREGWGDPHKVLLNVAYTKTQVRVQIENSQIRFNALICTTHNGSVMVGKPFGVNSQLAAGSFVRLRLPGAHKRELRLEVMLPHLNLSNGHAAFVCRPPKSLTSCRRHFERYDTMRYSNLRLTRGQELYRLVDLSNTGLKVFLTGTQGPNLFPLGRDIAGSQLVLGLEAHVDLVRLTPRNYQHGMIGCEYAIASDSASQRYHRHLMESVSRSQPE